jgi:ABC-2 type transport system permease protein
MNVDRVLAVARKEAIQLRRDTRSMILAFILPMLMILFFGYAITFDVANIEIAVVDQDRTPTSRSLVERFESSGYFRIITRIDDARELDGLLDRGTVRVGLVIPAGFAADLLAGRTAPLQLLLDGGDANTATIAQSYAEVIVARFSARALSRGREAAVPVTVSSRVWYNETLESVNMIVPGLIAVIMSIIAAMLTALTIAREWERGTMEQLAATPVGRFEIIAGKLLPYIGIGVVDVTLAIIAGRLVFQVPFRGDLLLLGVLTLLFLIGALSFGMFLSAALKSQVLATQAAMVSTYLPALLLSGFLYSIANMPVVLRAFTYLIPARYYIAVTRGIFLKGVGAEVLWTQAVAMVVFATAGLALATRTFRKEITA